MGGRGGVRDTESRRSVYINIQREEKRKRRRRSKEEKETKNKMKEKKKTKNEKRGMKKKQKKKKKKKKKQEEGAGAAPGGGGAPQTLSGQQLAGARPGLAGGPRGRPRVQHGHRGGQGGAGRSAAHGAGRLPQPEETLHLLVLAEQQQQQRGGARGGGQRGTSRGWSGSSRCQGWVVMFILMTPLSAQHCSYSKEVHCRTRTEKDDQH